MKQTVLANPGSIGISFAGVDDRYKIIANLLMFVGKLSGSKACDADIMYALEKDGLEVTPENIARVKSFFESQPNKLPY